MGDDFAEVLAGRRAWAVAEGDCLDVLATMPEGCVDAVVTDPPYGTDVPRDGYGRRQLWHGTRRIAGDSDLSAFRSALAALSCVMRRDSWLVTFCSPKRHAEAAAACTAAGFPVQHEVVWDKKAPGLGGGIRYQHETVLLCASGFPSGLAALFSVLRYAGPREDRTHPHEKPVGLLCDLLEYACRPGSVVLDPFAGSGSTGVACRLTGRRFLGVELSPEYAALSRRRIADACPLLDAAASAGEVSPLDFGRDPKPESRPPEPSLFD